MKNSKISNFILEISQVLLVFLGMYSAIMCGSLSIGLTVSRGVLALVILLAALLFYGLFTVLETFHRGKLYGMLGITAFFAITIVKFRTVLQKGIVTIINTYLKEFMNYTQTTKTLLSGKGFEKETADVGYCTTLVLCLLCVYLIAVISTCFYRKRRSSVYVAATIFFVITPFSVGKIGYFSNVVTYIFVTMAVVGTRFLRYDTTEKRMRQKLSLILAAVGVIAGVISFLIVPPERYESNQNRILGVRNTTLSLTTWSTEDILTWIREYFNGDCLDYGKIGNHNSVNRTGKTILKIKGDFNTSDGLYMKGYTGEAYDENRWHTIKEEEYTNELNALTLFNLSPDGWHASLRNQIGDKQTTGNDKIWNTGKLQIKNLAFGYGNYVIPYYPTSAFSLVGGRSQALVPGIEYETEYYPMMYRELKNGLVSNHYNLAGNNYWTETQEKRSKMTDFVKKYFLAVPEDAVSITEDFKSYLAAQGNLLEQYQQGNVSLYQMVEETRNYIMNDTKYTLSPGKTPKSQEAVTYFLKENKKGYCAHYATAAAILLRSIGIPTRYAEGVYISKEELADVTHNQKEISVSDKDLHAWVEVYQENYGFVPVEFTPGRGDEDAESSAVSDEDSEQNKQNQQDKNAGKGGGEGQLSVATPTPEPEEDMTFENIQTDNYNHEDEEQAQEETGENETTDKKDTTDVSDTSKGLPIFVKVLLRILIVLVLLVLAAEIQRHVRIVLFKNKLYHGKEAKQILLLYHQLEKAFVQKHIRYTGQTVAEYSHEIAEAYGLDEHMVHAFITEVFCAKFSKDRFGKSKIYEYRQEYRKIRHQIYGQLKWPMKLYYMYILCI
ncbi:MAG: transglutaminase family protein [Eubacterium sp.]